MALFSSTPDSRFVVTYMRDDEAHGPGTYKIGWEAAEDALRFFRLLLSIAKVDPRTTGIVFEDKEAATGQTDLYAETAERLYAGRDEALNRGTIPQALATVSEERPRAIGKHPALGMGYSGGAKPPG